MGFKIIYNYAIGFMENILHEYGAHAKTIRIYLDTVLHNHMRMVEWVEDLPQPFYM